MLLSDNRSCRPPTEQQQGVCLTERLLFTVDGPLLTQHCPSVGQSGTRFTVTDLSSRMGSQQAAVRKAGLWRRQRGFSCIHLPWEKNTPKDFTVKSGNSGMFVCLNSSKHAVIEVFHSFCSLLISCFMCLTGPFHQKSNFLLCLSSEMTNLSMFVAFFFLVKFKYIKSTKSKLF